MLQKNQLSILQILDDVSGEFIDFSLAILKAGYGASQSEINRKFYENNSRRINRDNNRNKLIQDKACYYATLNSLQSDNLIEKRRIGRKLQIKITELGKNRLKIFKTKNSLNLPTKNKNIDKSGNKDFIIVAFDIPEKDRWKRSWLRAALLDMEMKPIQKSVWAGKTAVFKEFIDDLRTLELINCVEIFSINKSGTLKRFMNR